MYKKYFLLVVLFCMILYSCKKKEDIIVSGFKPIYISQDSLYMVYNSDTQPIINTGNILIWNEFLFVNEISKGIHVIDKSNPALARKITFINIIGNKNFSISDSTLYADNGKDLLTIDIRDIYHITLVNILKDAISNPSNLVPDSIGSFECVDSTKGYVIGWQRTTLINPKCYYNR